MKHLSPFIFRINISPCPVLPTAVSQLFPFRDPLQIFDIQDLALALEADDNRPAMYSPT
jgi:hypothetical protein